MVETDIVIFGNTQDVTCVFDLFAYQALENSLCGGGCAGHFCNSNNFFV